MEGHANVNSTTTLLRPLDSTWLSPPRSASSHQRTFQLPSQLASHSSKGICLQCLHPLDHSIRSPGSRFRYAACYGRSRYIRRWWAIVSKWLTTTFLIVVSLVPAPMPGPSTSRPSTTPLRPRSSLSLRGSLRHHDQSRRTSLELPGR